MKHCQTDTIVAIATPVGVGGIGVIRISGPKARIIGQRLFRSNNHKKFKSHIMVQGWIVKGNSKQKIDQAMACYMKAPKTYTGDDTVEVYCHGGMAIVRMVLGEAIRLGARLARRGEFTKRAYLNGKLDLIQAEAILDLISATTEAGAGLAVKQLEGRLSNVSRETREILVNILARVEAELDFSEDIGKLKFAKIKKKIKDSNNKINKLISAGRANRVFQEGLAVSIVGKPNVGKSSLLNALLGEDRAIVHHLPGTTRDTIVEGLEINGLPVKFVDTAGLRQAKGKVEKVGVERAREEIDASGLIVLVLDASRPLAKIDKQIIDDLKKRKGIVALNKVDLKKSLKFKSQIKKIIDWPRIKTSALKGQGIDELRKAIYDQVVTTQPKDALSINQRHLESLLRASAALLRAEQANSFELAAIDLKEAIKALGEVSGEEISVEVINKIFEQFCVGK